MSTINERMKQIREACGMTTEEFSIKLGVSRSSVEHIESGRNQPNVVFVTKLHQHFLQYSLEYILYDESSDISEVKVKESFHADVDMSKQDPMLCKAAELVVVHQLGSISLIQRKFSIGYNHAERIMDKLERIDIEGPAQGNKARDVLCADLTDLDMRWTRSESLDIEEIRQIIAFLKRGIARLESWIDDMNDEGVSPRV